MVYSIKVKKWSGQNLTNRTGGDGPVPIIIIMCLYQAQNFYLKLNSHTRLLKLPAQLAMFKGSVDNVLRPNVNHFVTLKG